MRTAKNTAPGSRHVARRPASDCAATVETSVGCPASAGGSSTVVAGAGPVTTLPVCRPPGRACGSRWCRAGWRSAVTATAVQAGNVTARAAAAGMAECAHFVELLRFCILTTDMEFADGGSRATGASAFTMVVVVSGGSVLVFVRPKCSELIRAEALAPWHFALSALSRRWAQPSPQTNNQLATALV